jgi:hypothetical protein
MSLPKCIGHVDVGPVSSIQDHPVVTLNIPSRFRVGPQVCTASPDQNLV